MGGDGASNIEVLFTSAEDAKPPTVLAAEAGYIKSGSPEILCIYYESPATYRSWAFILHEVILLSSVSLISQQRNIRK